MKGRPKDRFWYANLDRTARASGKWAEESVVVVMAGCPPQGRRRAHEAGRMNAARGSLNLHCVNCNILVARMVTEGRHPGTRDG